MISLISSPLITTFGMVRCEACSAAASAALDRPGVLAMASKVGALASVERPAHFVHEVALGAYLTRLPEALLSTADLRCLRAARRRPYHRGDDEANHRCHTDQRVALDGPRPSRGHSTRNRVRCAVLTAYAHDGLIVTDFRRAGFVKLLAHGYFCFEDEPQRQMSRLDRDRAGIQASTDDQ